jgi:hypothetical protein
MSRAPRFLQEGQPVRLELPGQSSSSIEATIHEISEHLLWLDCAIDSVISLRVGQHVVLRCWDPFGAYCALTQITQLADTSPPLRTRIAVEAAVPVEASDNRRFYRVNVHVPFVFAARGGDEAKATTIDLSPGGLKFSTTQPFAAGDSIEIRLPYGASSIELEGRVVRALVPATRADASRGRSICVEFSGASDEDQLKIVRLIFEHQQRAGSANGAPGPGTSTQSTQSKPNKAKS